METDSSATPHSARVKVLRPKTTFHLSPFEIIRDALTIAIGICKNHKRVLFTAHFIGFTLGKSTIHAPYK